MLRWMRRLVFVALLGAAIRWLLSSPDRRRGLPGRSVPVIGGDTWPPVPVNQKRNQ